MVVSHAPFALDESQFFLMKTLFPYYGFSKVEIMEIFQHSK